MAEPNTVTVGCRLPNGLILQLHEMKEVEKRRPDGTSFTDTEARARSGRVTLNGSARFRGGERETAHDIRHGAGLTFGVDAAFFAEWMKVHADMEIVKSGLVFAHRSNDVAAQARDHRHQATGMEPLNPKDLPAEFKGKIETGKAA